MEDILNEIITLSEKNKKEKQKETDKKSEENDIESQKKEQRNSTQNIKKKKKKKSYTKYSSNSSCNSSSIYNGSNSSHNDTSTCCTIEDIKAEKVNIFNKIINEKKKVEKYDSFIDIEKNIDEQTPLFQNRNNMNSYLINVNQINIGISQIYKNIDKINIIKKKIDLNIYDNEKLYKKINVIINQSEQIVEQIKKQINELNFDNDEFEKISKLVSEIKLRINIFIDVVNKYRNCVNKYKNICNQYYEHVNKNLVKRYKLINPNISNQSLQKLLKNNNQNTIEDIMSFEKTCSNNLMHSASVEQIEYEKIKENYRELKILEKNILSLNELYIELAYVIKKRKNLINSIENNVYQVKDYTESALINIVEAKKYNTLIKQKIMYFSTFLLIVAFIVLFPIFFNFIHF